MPSSSIWWSRKRASPPRAACLRPAIRLLSTTSMPRVCWPVRMTTPTAPPSPAWALKSPTARPCRRTARGSSPWRRTATTSASTTSMTATSAPTAPATTPSIPRMQPTTPTGPWPSATAASPWRAAPPSTTASTASILSIMLTATRPTACTT